MSETPASAFSAEEEIGRLAGGLFSGNWSTALRAYRALYQAGPSVVPTLRDIALRAEWPDSCSHEAVRYIATLVSLVHDLDERESRELVDNLVRRGAGRVVTRILRLATAPSITDYSEYACNGLRLLIHRELPKEYEAESNVPRWLSHVEETALQDIAMIFVTPHGPSDRSGDYMPSLCSIRVIWRGLGLHVPGMVRLAQLGAEHTLYHEIGHHALRHGFGQIPHQEKEADQFAAACHRRSHPVVARVVAPLMWPLATLSRAIAGQTKPWEPEMGEQGGAADDVHASGRRRRGPRR